MRLFGAYLWPLLGRFRILSNTCHILKLPPELLDLILQAVSLHPGMIRACRLVCRSFKGPASKLFEIRLAVARRGDTLQLTDNALKAGAVSEYVTEVVVDVSNYRDDPAQDFETYVAHCERSSRNFYDDKLKEEAVAYAALYKSVYSSEWRGREDSWETHGFRRGFYEYYQRWETQNLIDKDGLYRATLKKVLILPNLRRVVFGDFLSLAKPGESYSELCNRLFGNTLEPVTLSFFDTTQQEFQVTLDTLSQRHHPIQQFLVGGHPNDPLKSSANNQSSSSAPVFPCARLKSEWKNISLVFGKLKELRLPITVSTYNPPGGNPTAALMLNSSVHCLVRLTLIGSDMLSRGRHVEDLGRSLLKDVLLSTEFRSLKDLGLYDWWLPSLKEFLLKHWSTLTKLHLVGCRWSEDPDSPYDPEPLARWAGQYLSLSGVEIRARTVSEEASDDASIEALWLGGRPNSLRQ